MWISIGAITLFCFSVHAFEIEEWLMSTSRNRGSDYDDASIADFLINTKSDLTGVFSPITSEMNVLLQAAGNEYEKESATPAISYLEEILSKVEESGTDRFLALNRIYFPQNESRRAGNLVFSSTGLKYIPVTIYDQEDTEDCKELLDEHHKWVDEKSNHTLTSSLGIDSFTHARRIYASLMYFKDDWAEKFDKGCTVKEDFYLDENETTKREFMVMEAQVGYYHHISESRPRGSFKIAAVPYAEKNEAGKYNRHMIYIVPEDKNADLSVIWDEFLELSENKNLNNKLFKELETVDLRIPKVEKLKSTYDLTEILKNVYGNGPAEYVVSTMSTYINIDEEGTEASCIVETDSADGCFMKSERLRLHADRPYISFVFDRTLNRVIVVLKDTGKRE